MPEPEPCGGEGHGRQEVASELVVAGRDASEVLELVEEALDEIAMPVDVRIDRAADAHVALAGDVSVGAVRFDDLDDGASEVATVGHDVARQAKALEQLGRGGLVGCLARREYQANRQTAGVDDGVDFCGQSSTRTANGVIRAPFFPPAACWWARTIEESIR